MSTAQELEQLLTRLRALVAEARPVPLSTSVIIHRDEAMDLIDTAIEMLPEDLKRARRIISERDQVIGEGEHEAQQLIEQARARVEQLVSRTEIVREARRVADQMLSDAEHRSRQMQHETEDYVDQKLASFEIVLERTLRTVHKGRSQLQPQIDDSGSLNNLAPDGTGEIAGTYDELAELGDAYDQPYEPAPGGYTDDYEYPEDSALYEPEEPEETPRRQRRRRPR